MEAGNRERVQTAHHWATDGFPTRLLSVIPFWMGRCASVIELGSSTALEHLVTTEKMRVHCNSRSERHFWAPDSQDWGSPFPSRNIEVVSCPSFTISTGRRIGLSLETRVVAGSSPASGSKCRNSSVVEHVTPSSTLIRRLDLVCGQQNTRRHASFDRSQPAGQYPIAKKTRFATTAARSID